MNLNPITPYTPLISSSSKTQWRDHRTWSVESQMQAVKIGFIALAALSGLTFISCIADSLVKLCKSVSLLDQNLEMEILIISVIGLAAIFLCPYLFTRPSHCKSTHPLNRSYQLLETFDRYWHVRGSQSIRKIQAWRPKIERVMASLKDKKLLSSWLKSNRIYRREWAIKKIFRTLKKGMCLGYTAAVLQKAYEQPQLPTQQLFRKITLENVFYFQVWSLITWDLSTSFKSYKKLWEVILNQPFDKSSNSFRAHYWQPYLFTLFHFLNTNRSKLSIEYSSILDISNLNDSNLQHFTESYLREAKERSHQLHDMGIITLIPRQRKRCAHALFFQLGTQYCRFYDPGCCGEFFQFPNRKLFFNGLFHHIKNSSDYRDGTLSLLTIGRALNS